MNILLLFLDGVGLGEPDPAINPFVAYVMPNLSQALDGKQLTNDLNFPIITKRATLIQLDACLGVEGLPQSATGQATLLTGLNIPELVGYHYGPKPNPEVAKFLQNGNLFRTLNDRGAKTSLLNAFPTRYFETIKSGYRLPGAIAMAALQANVRLLTVDDFYAGKALSADVTGIGWQDHLGFLDAPVISPAQAGSRMTELARRNQFSLFEYWLSDVAGHNQNMDQGMSVLKTIDEMFAGLLETWDDADGLVLMVSDHGNLEDLSTRRHTYNPVPLLLLGSHILRQQFIDLMLKNIDGIPSLQHIYPAILGMLT